MKNLLSKMLIVLLLLITFSCTTESVDIPEDTITQEIAYRDTLIKKAIVVSTQYKDDTRNSTCSSSGVSAGYEHRINNNNGVYSYDIYYYGHHESTEIISQFRAYGVCFTWYIESFRTNNTEVKELPTDSINRPDPIQLNRCDCAYEASGGEYYTAPCPSDYSYIVEQRGPPMGYGVWYMEYFCD